MDASMDIGIVSRVMSRDFLDNAPRNLRRRGVIQIDQRLSVKLLAENGEILPYRSNRLIV